MTEEFKWIMGVSIGLVTLIGGVITRDRQLNARICDAEEKIRMSENVMHERINTVKDTYAKKADVDNCINLLRSDMHRVRDEIRKDLTETNKRLDTIINSMTASYSQSIKPPSQY